MSKMSTTLAVLGVVAGLGVTALPLSSYAAESTDGGAVSENATVKLTIEKKLSLTLDKTEADLGDGSQTPAIAATVITNNTKGYNLMIAGSTATGAVKTVLTSGTVKDDIVALGAGVDAPAALTATTSSVWGYTVTGDDIVTGFTGEGAGKYAGVKETGEIIASKSAATAATGNITTVTFGADLIANQAAGTYEGQVTFTASDNA